MVITKNWQRAEKPEEQEGVTEVGDGELEDEGHEEELGVLIPQECDQVLDRELPRLLSKKGD